MRRAVTIQAILGLGLCLSLPARADWDDRPGVDFSPVSSADAPCGTGTPPRGHFSPEISTAGGVTLTVRQDRNRLCYVNGSIADAPVLRVRQGAELTVTLRNEITDPKAIADAVTINKLDTANAVLPAMPGTYKVRPGMHHVATGMTNLHVHGFAVPPVVPQDEVLTTCTDPAVGPAMCGHREFTYHYRVPANMPAGLYWYHPHVHGEVQAQMLMGLSGAIVVEGPEDDARRAAGIEDRIFIVRQDQDNDSPVADEDAPAPPKAATEMEPAAPPAAGLGGAIETAHELACSNNSEADQITLNGSKVFDGNTPDSELAPLEIADGTRQFWRIVNAATDAFLDLALLDEAGKPLPIEIVARDGAPLTDDAGRRLHSAPTTQSQLVPPAGRLEFLVAAPRLGGKAYFITHAVDTGCAGDKVPGRKLAVLKTVPGPAVTSSATAFTPAASAPDYFSGLVARLTDRKRVIAFAEYPRPGTDDQTDFYIVERRPGAELKPFEMGDPPVITVKAGATEEWVVENWTNELHAFHMHQVHFRVLEQDGKPVAVPPLLDTVNVPYAHIGAGGTLVPGRVRVKMSFPPDLAGDIPFHCHLVDHEDNGMMAVIRVEPPGGARPIRKAEVAPGFAPFGQAAICRAPQARPQD
jgi:FtsP/CotA-like multicopper oxidase with cupredoxin domain